MKNVKAQSNNYWETDEELIVADIVHGSTLLQLNFNQKPK